MNLLKMTTENSHLARIALTNKIGVTGDYFKITLGNLPVNGKRNLEVNMKSSFGGIEIGRLPERANVPIDVENKVNGRVNKKTITVDLEGASRITPTSISGTPKVAVATTDNLFGIKQSVTVY